MNKKGDFGYPWYFWPSLVLLLILLIFFTLTFFTLGLAKSGENVIPQTDLSDSITLRNILRTEFEGLNIADLVGDISSDSSLIKLKYNLPKLLTSLPKPDNKMSSWNFVVADDKKEILHLGDMFGKSYYVQNILLPARSKKVYNVFLYLSCASCGDGGIVVKTINNNLSPETLVEQSKDVKSGGLE